MEQENTENQDSIQNTQLLSENIDAQTLAFNPENTESILPQSSHDNLESLDLTADESNIDPELSSNLQQFSSNSYLSNWAPLSEQSENSLRFVERSRGTTRSSLIPSVSYIARLSNNSQIRRTPLRLIRPSGSNTSSFVAGFELQESDGHVLAYQHNLEDEYEDSDQDQEDSERDQEDSDQENEWQIADSSFSQAYGSLDSEAENNEIEKHLSQVYTDADADDASINLFSKLIFPTYLNNSHFGLLKKSQQEYIKAFLKLDPIHFSDSDYNWIDSIFLDSSSVSTDSNIDIVNPSIPQNYTVSKKTFKKLLEKNSVLRKSLEFPTHWNKSDINKNLKILNDMLQADYIGSGRDDEDSGMLRTNWPMPSTCGVFYYETTIINKGRNGYIGIGFCSSKVSLSRLPGWDPDSWGYHGDDGNSFKSNGHGTSYGPKFTTGDVIGCGMNFITHEAFFVKNGVFLGVAFKDLNPSFPLYPSVGMRTPGEKIKANFGQNPFVFDIESYIISQKNLLWDNIMDTSIKQMLESSTIKCLQTSTNPTDISCCLPITDVKFSKNEMDDTISNSLVQPTSENNLVKISLQDFNENKISPKNSLLFSLMNLSNNNSSLHNEYLPSEKDTINELILSYLIHHGHNNTADIFAKNVIGINTEAAKKTINSSKVFQINQLLDYKKRQVARRKEICNLVEQGKILDAIKILKDNYPSIFKNNPNLIFSLRCQYFVQLAEIANSGLSSFRNMISLSLENTTPLVKSNDFCDESNVLNYYERFGFNKLDSDKDKSNNSVEYPSRSNDLNDIEMNSGSDYQKDPRYDADTLQHDVNKNAEVDSVMEIDDFFPSTAISEASEMQLENTARTLNFQKLYFSDTFPDFSREYCNVSSQQDASKAMMCYGQKLNSYYSTFNDSNMDLHLSKLFLIFAFSDPLNNLHTKNLFNKSNLYEISKQTNSEILVAEGNLTCTPLETIYKQTEFCLSSLTEKFFHGSTSVISLAQKFKTQHR
ncbi:hypothetical protein BB561_001076 [Smittium simulii]|uniref:B30.2/SPRY domain-containing protein n=1 Tax=Smittium simulii TaxID=133385 RepID=A0A2T9YW80_9FUNG|nr:hypothetical protein BB561_001076 [Smittium simulii]